MANLHVFSKLSTDVTYHDYEAGGADLPVITKSVTINGGAGVATKHLVTPLGVHTEITEDQAELLNRNGIFQLHKKNGFVVIEKKKADVEKVAANMADTSDYKTSARQLTAMDFASDAAKPMEVKDKA